jgi:hypothetical protein
LHHPKWVAYRCNRGTPARSAEETAGVIVVQPEGGLANRLRVISSFRVLARSSERSFALSWALGGGWSDEDLDDLFENSLTRVTPDVRFWRLCVEALRLNELVVLAGIPSDGTCRWADVASFEHALDPEAFPVAAYRGCQPLSALLPAASVNRLMPGYGVEYAHEVRTWRPVRAIQQAIDRVVGAFGEHTVGVHIRRGDARAPQFQRSTDAAFMAAMDRELKADPDVRFFLATDCALTEERFRDKYGLALLTNSEKEFAPSLPGQPKANQRDAVIDLFALARTHRLLGNCYSSFSHFAGVLGGIEREDVVEVN